MSSIKKNQYNSKTDKAASIDKKNRNLAKYIPCKISPPVKYTREDRKHIVEIIENLKNNDDYVAIFGIITDDETTTHTKNSNGVYFNLTTMKDSTLDKINAYLNKVNKRQLSTFELEIDSIPCLGSEKKTRTYKLSNYERNILKQRNLKKVLNDDIDYEVMNFTKKNLDNSKSKTNKSKSYDDESVIIFVALFSSTTISFTSAFVINLTPKSFAIDTKPSITLYIPPIGYHVPSLRSA